MKRILFAIFVVLLSPQSFARGEWESSGAPTPPYIPQGELNYHCSLKARHSVGDRSQTQTRDFDLTTHEFANSGSVYRQIQKDDVAWMNGQNFSILFRRGATPAEDLIVLFSEALLPVKGAKMRAFSYAEASKAGKVVEGTVVATFERSAGPQAGKTASMSVTVTCREQ